jgi:amino acid transporter
MAFVVSYSGGATPFAFLLGAAVLFAIALVINQFAKRIPSAGSFYTYLTRTFGIEAGFVTGILLFFAYLLILPFQIDFFGNFVSAWLKSNNVSISWVVFAIALILVGTAFAIFGIKLSLNVGLIGLAFEMSILIIFSIVIIAHGGAAGNTLKVFNPSTSHKGFEAGILLAVVYTIFAFAGFESATTLGEEAREPEKTIPRAILLTVVILGAFFILVSYAVVIGYGVSDSGINSLVSASTPFNDLANRYGDGTLSTFVNIAVISSFIALNIVTVTALSRVIWKMGCEGTLPRILGRLNRRQAPDAACVLVLVLGLSVGLIFGLAYGPETFASWISYFATLFFIAAYLAVSIGLFHFIQRNYAQQFNWVLHALLPAISVVAVGWVLYGNIHPYPPSPLRYFIYATALVIVLASFVGVWLKRTNPEAMARAGATLAEVDDAELELL